MEKKELGMTSGFTTELTEEEAKKFREILMRFLNDYKAKGQEVADYDWLYAKLKEELPEASEEELKKNSEEIISSIQEHDKNLGELNEVCNKGTPKEKWFADKLQESAKGVQISDYGEHLKYLDIILEHGNEEMRRAITTNAGEISWCRNLDGFIAEQHQVNTFNAKAALENSPYKAEVCVPLEGEPYLKDSFDVIIKDIRTGKRVNQYQFKFGSDAKATINLLKHGNYNNQRFVVPEEQVQAVKEAFPNKSIESFIGGNGEIKTKSDPLTKQSAKEMQLKAQEDGTIPSVDWNSYNTKSLALNLGKSAGMSGIYAAAMTTGLDMARKVMTGEKIEADESIELALRTGADTGIKTATAGALKVASEKGVLNIIPKGTPAGIIATTASVGIENIKILLKVAKGDLAMAEALEQMGRTSTSMIAGMAAVGKGAAIGAAALSWVPVVGTIVGGLAGGMIGYVAGSKFGETIFNVAKKVGESAKNFAKKAWNKTKESGSTLKEKLFG